MTTVRALAVFSRGTKKLVVWHVSRQGDPGGFVGDRLSRSWPSGSVGELSSSSQPSFWLIPAAPAH